MGDIIKFPKQRTKKQQKIDNLLVEKLPNVEQHSNIGDVNFTCATCGTRSQLTFNYIVFKLCEFYCSACGTGYKISNPLFSSRKKTISK